jgi:hypothetical protein
VTWATSPPTAFDIVERAIGHARPTANERRA